AGGTQARRGSFERSFVTACLRRRDVEVLVEVYFLFFFKQKTAYEIHSGTVEIRRNFDGQERVLNRNGEGQPLGEIGLFRKGPRSATAIAADDVELLVIKEERLEWLVRNRPQLALELLKRLSNLVVATDQDRAQSSGVR